jgi:putative aldouronate transport system substrate-binding protein
MGKAGQALACMAILFSAGAGLGAQGLPKDPAKLSAPGSFPIVSSPVTIRIFVPSAGLVKDIRTNSSSLWLQRTTGVKIEWLETSKVEAKTRLAMMLASGDYPDVIMGMSGSGLAVQDIPRYGRAGTFIALNELIESQGHFIKECFEAQPGMREAVTSADGRIYGLPLVMTDDYHMTMRQKMWINAAWLDRLGLRAPESTEELYRVLKAFKERDPNGNGRADEIPLTGARRSQEDLASWIMSAFIPCGGPDDGADVTLNNYEFVVDGKLLFSADKPAFRDGLRFIARLYREGLIDVAGLTQDKNQIKPLVDASPIRVGMVASHHPANFASLSDDMSANIHQFRVLPPIRGPAGFRSTPWIIDGVVQPGQYVITDKCRNPVVAFRLADTMFSLDWALKEKGDQGLHWKVADPGMLGLDGRPAKYQYLKSLAMEDNAQINLCPGWTRDLKNQFARAPADTYSYEEFLYQATKLYEPAKVRRFPYATAQFAEADITEFTELRRNIHAFVGESVDRFIIGDLDIERQWEGYVRQLKQIGLERYMAILRAAMGGG